MMRLVFPVFHLVEVTIFTRMHKRQVLLDKIIAWARENDQVRLMLLTSSLANPQAPVDDFSDLDIELVLVDAPSFFNDHQWLSIFGKVIAKVSEGEEAFDGKNAMHMVLYDDHTKVDFKLLSVGQFLQIDELYEDWDVGYIVLVDKDGLSKGMPPPTYRSTWIKKPTAEKYNQVLNDFWWDLTYVAKCLARDNLFYAKFMTEDNIRSQYLVKMIEWYIGMQHNWEVTTNKYGRLFKQFLTPEMWSKIEATFSGSDIKDNWRALFAYTEIGRELGISVAGQLGYQYPYQLDKDIMQYLQKIRPVG
jgi:aminoglycoside 6-adenylyltransferase